MADSPIRAALDAAASAGPFFVLDTDPSPAVAGLAPAWRPFRDLVDDPTVLAARVAALTAAVADLGVSRKVLWGNVASALAGATPALLAAAGSSTGPVRAVVAGLLCIGPLAGAGSFRGPGGQFLRNSCCLYYRVPGG